MSEITACWRRVSQNIRAKIHAQTAKTRNKDKQYGDDQRMAKRWQGSTVNRASPLGQIYRGLSLFLYLFLCLSPLQELHFSNPNTDHSLAFSMLLSRTRARESEPRSLGLWRFVGFPVHGDASLTAETSAIHEPFLPFLFPLFSLSLSLSFFPSFHTSLFLSVYQSVLLPFDGQSGAGNSRSWFANRARATSYS